MPAQQHGELLGDLAIERSTAQPHFASASNLARASPPGVSASLGEEGMSEYERKLAGISGMVAGKEADTLLRSPAPKLPGLEAGVSDTGDRRASQDELLFLKHLQQQFQQRDSDTAESVEHDWSHGTPHAPCSPPMHTEPKQRLSRPKQRLSGPDDGASQRPEILGLHTHGWNQPAAGRYPLPVHTKPKQRLSPPDAGSTLFMV